MTEQSSPRSASIPTLPHAHGHFNRPHSLSRTSSARLSNAGSNSRTGSPATRPSGGSIGPLTEDFLLGGTRDECAFYQAETQTLTRENQMLKQRIRELGETPCICYHGVIHADPDPERQISTFSAASPHIHSSAAGATQPGSSAPASPLATQPSTFASEAAPSIAAEVDPAAKAD